MTLDLLLKHGSLIVNGRVQLGSVGIIGNKIAGVYLTGNEPPARQSIDCTDCFVLPGMIDIHVHLRDLGEANKEDYATGTMAAAAGGVTTVVDMPNSVPPVLDMSVLQEKIRLARLKRYVNIGFYAGVPKIPEDFEQDMVRDILGLKVYPHSPLSKGVQYTEERILACMRLASQVGRPLLIHPDSSTPSDLVQDIDSYFRLHSCEGELNSVKRFVGALKEVGGHLHVCHVSCGMVAEYIMENRAEDSLTAETTPHHLLLNSLSFPNSDGTAKMLPPLRSPYDNQVLLRVLCEKCALDCVASDHAPHTPAEKSRPFLEAASGIPGLETTVPLLLTEVLLGRMSWLDYLRVCCSAPARILGLGTKGILAPGYDADLVIVRRGEYVIRGQEFLSKAKVTPFEGRRVLAKPVITIVGGVVVYDGGDMMVGPGVAGTVPIRKH
ncbi:MAG: dihydroorotase family protein [Candidatus Thorarchaeota archaeon]